MFQNAPRIAIVQAPFYPEISKDLLNGAQEALKDCAVDVFNVPGALEISAAIALMVQLMDVPFDGFVALGCVIKGETDHYDIVCRESARSLQSLSISGICLGKSILIGNGILTCQTLAQAQVRADPKGRYNVGARAAQAALCLLALRQQLKV